MKTKLVANNDFGGIVVQCACIGHCSYIEFMRPYENRLWMAITTSNRKRKLLYKLDKIETLFNLTEDQAKDFIDMLADIEATRSNTYTIKDNNHTKKKLYIRFKYEKVDIKPSKYDIVGMYFYLSSKAFEKDDPCFDITLTRNMARELVKDLRGLYEDKQG